RWQCVKAVTWTAAGLAVVALVLTWGQTQLWHDDVTLWEHTLEVTGPTNTFAHGALGLVHWQQGRAKEATEHLREALRARHPDPEGRSRLGLFHLAQNDMDEADRYLRQAVALAPQSARAHNNLATGLYERGQLADAVEHYRIALSLRPNDDKLFYN